MKYHPAAPVRVVLFTALSMLLLACEPALVAPTEVPIRTIPVITATPSLAPGSVIYVSPSNAAVRVPPETTIAVRYNSDVVDNVVMPGLFMVSGSHSGAHRGTTVLSDDRRTIIFTPDTPFAPGEGVSVVFQGGLLGANSEQYESATFKFDISSKPTQAAMTPTSTPVAAVQNITPASVPTGRYFTAPGSLPAITVTNYITSAIPAGEYVFLNTSSNKVDQYLMILDNTGALVYYKQLPPTRAYTNFTVQPNGLLTYFDGGTATNPGNNVIHVLNSSYDEVDQYAAGNGYAAESHDFRLLPDGHALLTSYDEQPMDMTAVGGKPSATFIDLVVQELDQSKHVVFQWKASEHVPYTDTYESLTGDLVDPFHGNSLDVLPDGNLLISLRHLSQVLKVDRQTGAVIWRMGGKHSDFTFVNDEGFSYQHDVRWQPGDFMTVFDNGNQHKPQESRAVEYKVDELNRTVTRVWQFQHAPGIYGFYMGDVQPLPDGDTFVGWGGPRPIASLIAPDGQLAQDIEVGPPGGTVYRWYEFPWQSTPGSAPALVAQFVNGATTLYFSWNGVTDVAAYRVEAGMAPDQLEPLVTQPREGFETAAILNSVQSTACYYRVTALDSAGHDLRASDIAHLSNSTCI